MNRFTFVLHGHLPYVLSHGTWPHGTDWLLEAACETYIPLVEEIAVLVEEGISPKFTLSLTPALCEQLADERFKSSLFTYIEERMKAARTDAEGFARTGSARMADTAHMWEEFYAGVRRAFDRWGGDLLAPLRTWQEEGHIEVMTSAATHGYLPLLGRDEDVRAQIKCGVETYRRHFGRDPKGFWLPECAYRPGYEWSPPIPGVPIGRARRSTVPSHRPSVRYRGHPGTDAKRGGALEPRAGGCHTLSFSFSVIHRLLRATPDRTGSKGCTMRILRPAAAFLSPIDFLNLALLASLAVLLASAWSRTPYRTELSATYAALAGFVVFMAWLRTRRLPGRRAIFLVYPVLFLFVVFETFFMLLPFFNVARYDATMAAADRFLFGTDPCAWLGQFARPWLTELMALSRCPTHPISSLLLE